MLSDVYGPNTLPESRWTLVNPNKRMGLSFCRPGFQPTVAASGHLGLQCNPEVLPCECPTLSLSFLTALHWEKHVGRKLQAALGFLCSTIILKCIYIYPRGQEPLFKCTQAWDHKFGWTTTRLLQAPHHHGSIQRLIDGSNHFKPIYPQKMFNQHGLMNDVPNSDIDNLCTIFVTCLPCHYPDLLIFVDGSEIITLFQEWWCLWPHHPVTVWQLWFSTFVLDSTSWTSNLNYQT